MSQGLVLNSKIKLFSWDYFLMAYSFKLSLNFVIYSLNRSVACPFTRSIKERKYALGCMFESLDLAVGTHG